MQITTFKNFLWLSSKSDPVLIRTRVKNLPFYASFLHICGNVTQCCLVYFGNIHSSTCSMPLWFTTEVCLPGISIIFRETSTSCSRTQCFCFLVYLINYAYSEDTFFWIYGCILEEQVRWMRAHKSQKLFSRLVLLKYAGGNLHAFFTWWVLKL